MQRHETPFVKILTHGWATVSWRQCGIEGYGVLEYHEKLSFTGRNVAMYLELDYNPTVTKVTFIEELGLPTVTHDLTAHTQTTE